MGANLHLVREELAKLRRAFFTQCASDQLAEIVEREKLFAQKKGKESYRPAQPMGGGRMRPLGRRREGSGSNSNKPRYEQPELPKTRQVFEIPGKS